MSLGTKIKKVFPLCITGEDNRQNHVNLFRLTDLTENAHYVLNKTVSRLIRPQYSNYEDSHFFSPYCLLGCTSEKVLQKHVDVCKGHKA